MNCSYGKIRICDVERNIKNINSRWSYDYYTDIVDEVFHRQLKECEHKEQEYFPTIIRDYIKKYHTTFGVIISYSSSEMWIQHSEDSEYKRLITIEECEELIEKYKQLDALVDKITKQTDIKY